MIFSKPSPLSWTVLGICSVGLISNAQTTSHEQESETVELDTFQVSSDPFARNADELLQAASLLSGSELDIHRSGTLGETLVGMPGVTSTYFGPGASRPIIRGLDGDRIRVLTNSVGTIDVSSTSPDHAVSINPATMERAEVVRGPATLLYGSSAAGGIVNVIENSIPREHPESSATGSIGTHYGSGADEWAAYGKATGALSDQLVWSASLAHRDAGDTEIPGFAEIEHDEDDHHEDEEHDEEEEHDEHEEESAYGIIPNSAVTTTSGSLGLGWFWTGGRAGISVSGFDTEYGVPGHHHHEEEEEGDEEEEHEEHHEEAVVIELDKRRVDLAADITREFSIFRSARFRAAFADYEHTELEGDEVGTRFEKDGFEARVDLIHKPWNSFEGAIGAQILQEKTEAEGEEAFLPPTRMFDWAVFGFEEYVAGPVRWQLGARLEERDIKVLDDSAEDRSKLGSSFSGGALWTISQDWTAAVSLAYTQRNPTAQEWYANGPHVATSSYEIGNPDLGKEKSTSIDVNLRRRTGAVTGALSLFYTDYNRYIFANPTGSEIDGFTVYEYTARDARFYGAELEATWHLHESPEHSFDVTFVGDLVNARNTTDDEYLPRTPPVRAGIEISYTGQQWTAGLDVHHAFDQNDVAPDESTSDSYTLVGARVGYTIPAGDGTVGFFLRATNLFNEEARPHTSYLRDVAPLPGRNLQAGIRWGF